MSEELAKLTNGVKLVGETILPGTSQLMDGNIASGAGHAIVGIAARALIGPIGWGLVAANSFSKSASGSSLWQLVTGSKSQPQAEQVQPAPEATPAAS
ncbi:MAG: hypothetical protein ACI9FJ_001883 [Alteromonadaceae bacterium]|jgi:hypothetical protein